MHLFDDGWSSAIRSSPIRSASALLPDAKLTPWPKDLQQWEALSWDEKKLFIKQADVFGVYLAYTDYEIGRVIQAVEDMGKLNDTLIMYIGC